jgi:hypothetical protein
MVYAPGACLPAAIAVCTRVQCEQGQLQGLGQVGVYVV